MNLIMKHSYLFFILFCFTACGQPHNNNVDSSFGNPIPDSICFFFPIDETIYISKFLPLGLSQKSTNLSVCCKYHLVVSKDNIDFDNIKDFAEKHFIQKLCDTSKLVILKDRDFDKREQLDSSYINAQISNIIPDFRMGSVYEPNNVDSLWVDSTTKTGLSEGYLLYVIKSGNTFVLDDNWDCNRMWLPSHLQHGYRSGIAINPDNEYVVFWCIAW